MQKYFEAKAQTDHAACASKTLHQLVGLAILHCPLDLDPQLGESLSKQCGDIFDNLVRARRGPSGLAHILLCHPSPNDVHSLGSELLAAVLDQAFDSCLPDT